MTNTTLKWKRTDVGRGLKAVGATKVYFVSKHPLGGYQLEIYARDGKWVGDHVDTDHHREQRMAKLTAVAYEALGDDYRAADHGHRERTTEAVRVAYEHARRVELIDRLTDTQLKLVGLALSLEELLCEERIEQATYDAVNADFCRDRVVADALELTAEYFVATKASWTEISALGRGTPDELRQLLRMATS